MLKGLSAARADLVRERPDGERDDLHFTLALARCVVAAYSKAGDWVLDPFAGYGTTLVAAADLGRRCVGVELLEQRARVAQRRVRHGGHVVVGDARRLWHMLDLRVGLCLTSPPYMAELAHPQNPLTGYTTLDGDYVTYLHQLEDVFRQVSLMLARDAHVVVNVADTGPDGSTALVDHLTERVSRHLRLVERLPVVWDDPPPGISNDTCIVYRAR